MRIAGLIMGFGLLLAACSTASDTPPPEVELATMPEMTNPEAFTQADQNACAAAGGTYEQAGMLGWFRCTQSFADGGKVCRDGDDCMGRCMSDGTGAAFNEDGTPKPVTGVCAANDNPFGCYATIEDGFSTGTLCVD